MYKIDKSNKAFPNEDVYFEQLNQQQKIKLFHKIICLLCVGPNKEFKCSICNKPSQNQVLLISKIEAIMPPT